MSLVEADDREKLWHLFQACDTDGDGVVNGTDIRSLCSRNDFTTYRPEEIMDLFDMTDNSQLTFEDFLSKKRAQHQLSEATSISSDLTSQTVDDHSFSDHYDSKDYFATCYKPVSDLDIFKEDHLNNLVDIDRSLCESLDNLRVTKSSVYSKHNFDSSSGYTTISSTQTNSKYPNRSVNFKKYQNQPILPDEMDSYDMSEEARKKVKMIYRDYINCLNELSEENESICEELDQLLKDQNYLQQKLKLAKQEYLQKLKSYQNEWNCERRQFEQRIEDLESIAFKQSSMNANHWFDSDALIAGERDKQIEENYSDRLSTNFDLQSDLKSDIATIKCLSRSSNEPLYNLWKKALELSEIISNLRSTEIGILVANCRAAGLGKAINLNDDHEQEEIMRIFEQAMLNRTLAEGEAINFIKNVNQDILIKYCPVEHYEQILGNNNNNQQILFDLSFQNILVDLLDRIKKDLKQTFRTEV